MKVPDVHKVQEKRRTAMHKVTLLPGDGVGPEIAEATRKCVEATGVKIQWDVQECGIEVIEAKGGVPASVLESIRANGVALKAPITTPIGKGFRSVNVYLRQELGLYACVRPCKTYKGVRTFFESCNVDLVIVRENTEDLYAGVEFKAGEAVTEKLIGQINEAASGKKITTGLKTTGVSIKPMSIEGTTRIADYAFKYAVENKRKSVTSISKASFVSQEEAVRIKNDNLALRKSLVELRAQKAPPVAAAVSPTGKAEAGKKPIPKGGRTHTVAPGDVVVVLLAATWEAPGP